MPIIVVKNGRTGCPKKGRLLGLDLGSKTIGIAISDDTQSIATAVTTIQRTKFSQDIAVLGQIIDDFDKIAGYVVGWPLHMDGRAGPRCDAVRSFCLLYTSPSPRDA